MATGTISNVVFSEYELRELAIKFNDEDSGTWVHADCVGAWEDEGETLTVTKNCRGKVAKKRTMATGSGTVTWTGHIPESIKAKMYDMVREDLAAGVQGYGRDNRHKEFTCVGRYLDEDGKEKFFAYPCMVANTYTTSNENGSEEVAEREVELSYMPDEHGYGKYEALVADLGTDANQLKTKWMTAWTPELMQASPAA